MDETRRSKRERVPFWIAITLIIGVLGFFVLLGLAPRHPGAPVGAPTTVLAAAYQVTDAGVRVRQDNRDAGADGVRISFDDGMGSSGSSITGTLADGSPAYSELPVLSGHRYTITASSNGSTLSVFQTIRSYRPGWFKSGTTGGGWVIIDVRTSDNRVIAVSYLPPSTVGR